MRVRLTYPDGEWEWLDDEPEFGESVEDFCERLKEDLIEEVGDDISNYKFSFWIKKTC